MTEENKKTHKKVVEEKVHEGHEHGHKNETHEEKAKVEHQKNDEKSEKPKEEKKPVHEKKKKTEASVYAENIPISTKQSAAICKFIKNKKIAVAIEDLENVMKMKRAVPMKGEIPHRKGKGMMSGRFPQKSSENFIRLLKSLKSNSDYNGLDNPVIVEAYANIGVRPYGRFGAVRKKRTHIKIVAKDLQIKI